MNALASALGLQRSDFIPQPGLDGPKEFRRRDRMDARMEARAGMDAGAPNLSPAGLDPRSASPRQEAGALHGAAQCPAAGAFILCRPSNLGGGAYLFLANGVRAIVSDEAATRFTSQADARAAAVDHKIDDFGWFVWGTTSQACWELMPEDVR